MPIANCDDVQKKIDVLLQEIDKLRNNCLNGGTPSNDSLKIPKNLNNFAFARGKWKSTTEINNTHDGMKVVLYFDFNGSDIGKMSFVHTDNTVCEADVNLSISNNEILVNQKSINLCVPNIKTYKPYKFVFKAGHNGTAECFAQNLQIKNNNFSFNLIKIN